MAKLEDLPHDAIITAYDLREESDYILEKFEARLSFLESRIFNLERQIKNPEE